MGNFIVTAARVVGEAETREEARDLAQAALESDPDVVLTIREATGASADEKMTRTEGESLKNRSGEDAALPKEPKRGPRR